MPREKSHGAGQYRRGCRCVVCREAHAALARAWRAKRRQQRDLEQLDDKARAQALADMARPVDESQAPLLLDPSAPPGDVEAAFVEEFGALVGEPPWKRTLGALGRANARIVDQTYRHQRLDVLSGVQLRMMEILDRLRRLPGGGASAPADISALLGDPD